MGIFKKSKPQKRSKAEGESDRGVGPYETLEDFAGSLRPGERVDLLMDGRDGQPPTDVRRVSLLDVIPDRGIIVSQPEIPIPPSMVERRIEGSVLRKFDAQIKPQRIDFSSVVRELIDDYQLVGSSVRALLLEFPREVRRGNLRFAFRLNIPMGLTPRVRLHNKDLEEFEQKFNLVDISASGVLVNYLRPFGEQLFVNKDDIVYFEIDLKRLVEYLDVQVFADQTELVRMHLQCRLVRTYEEQERGLVFGALNFLNVSDKEADLLYAVLMKLQLDIANRGL